MEENTKMSDEIFSLKKNLEETRSINAFKPK